MEEDLKQLYELKEQIDQAVHDNFGCCPNERWFSELEGKWRAKEIMVKATYPEEFEKYVTKAYA